MDFWFIDNNNPVHRSRKHLSDEIEDYPLAIAKLGARVMAACHVRKAYFNLPRPADQVPIGQSRLPDAFSSIKLAGWGDRVRVCSANFFPLLVKVEFLTE